MPWLFYGAGFDADLNTKRDGLRRFADEVIAPLSSLSSGGEQG